MKMEINGKTSSGKRTRHMEIKYFYVTDLIERKEIKVEYCPTDSMIVDYMTKPITGSKFNKFRRIIMNIDSKVVWSAGVCSIYVRFILGFSRS
jgi:hypothetical protein